MSLGFKEKKKKKEVQQSTSYLAIKLAWTQFSKNENCALSVSLFWILVK